MVSTDHTAAASNGTTNDPNEKESFSHKHEETVSERAPGSADRRDWKGTGETGEEEELRALNAKLANPLHGLSKEELFTQVDAFAREQGLEDIQDDLRKGALVAQSPMRIDEIEELDEDERHALWNERNKKWDQTWTMYWLVFMCSMGAATQGMDETVINGAQLYYPKQFGIGDKNSQHDTLIVGLVNGAPYLASAVLGCWLTYPFCRFFGRRGAIFISTFFAFACCVWSGATNSWQHLFAARFVLGLGIGPKSASIPIFAAECAPAPIRGALVMQWQVWTAFGIMLGTVSSLIFYNVPDRSGIVGLSWRLMLGSACLPALLVCTQVYFVPESPRWLMGKGQYRKAYRSLLRLRKHKIQACRDLFYTSKLLEEEKKVEAQQGQWSKFLELFTIPRNARATLASGVVMFGQQFCGVNAIAYYSSNVFSDSGFSNTSSLLGSFGFGLLNWLFALPAFFTIDTFGRRNLLLVTYPGLAVTMLIAGLGFQIKSKTGRVGLVTFGMYAFTCFYSPGMGPVPFSYSAECFPLYIREFGMAYATALTWLFNFIIAFTFPLLVLSFTETGAFCWYAAWNVVLFFLSLLFVVETKQLTLEELDQVFSVPTWKHARYHITTPAYAFRKHVLRQKVDRAPLYEYEGELVGDGNAVKA